MTPRSPSPPCHLVRGLTLTLTLALALTITLALTLALTLTLEPNPNPKPIPDPTQASTQGYHTSTVRSVVFLIEASDHKPPAESELGHAEAVLHPGTSPSWGQG